MQKGRTKHSTTSSSPDNDPDNDPMQPIKKAKSRRDKIRTQVGCHSQAKMTNGDSKKEREQHTLHLVCGYLCFFSTRSGTSLAVKCASEHEVRLKTRRFRIPVKGVTLESTIK
jgi:hypothetical protein